jgi:hypothetical protein
MADDMIELVGQDGTIIPCRLLEISEFKGKQYGVLIKLDTKDPYVLEYLERDGESIFRNIEDEEEFEDVVAMVRTLILYNRESG